LQAWACHWEALGFEPQSSPFSFAQKIPELPRNSNGGQGFEPKTSHPFYCQKTQFLKVLNFNFLMVDNHPATTSSAT
jgi:hypothetical protein